MIDRTVDAKRRNLARGKLEVNDLVLCAQNVHFADIRDRQDFRANVLDLVA